MIFLSFTNHQIQLLTIDAVGQIIHMMTRHDAIQKILILYTIKMNAQFGKTRWEANGMIDGKLTVEVVTTIL